MATKSKFIFGILKSGEVEEIYEVIPADIKYVYVLAGKSSRVSEKGFHFYEYTLYKIM